jgi:hypothetical protein
MLIASKRKLKQYSEDPHILISNHTIRQVTNKKVLGFNVNEELKWKKHNDAQCKTLSKSTVKIARSNDSQNTLVSMFNE